MYYYESTANESQLKAFAISKGLACIEVGITSNGYNYIKAQ